MLEIKDLTKKYNSRIILDNINFTFRKGAFQPGETAYLYVTDANGEVNTEGFPIVINSPDLIAPMVPSGLNVL